MVVDIQIELENIEQFEAKMSQLDTGIQMEVHEALNISANLIKADAMAAAPVKTGFLRSTIYAVAQATWVFKIGAWCHYARYQEYGTRYIRAVKFLQNAIKFRWPQIREIIRRALILAAEGAGL